MWCAREEVVWSDFFDGVVPLEHCNVASLSDWVTGKIDDGFRLNLIELFDELCVAAGAWRIEDYGLVWRDVFRDVFGLCEDALGVRAFGVLLHFFIGGAVYFDESQFFVASNGEADTADAGIKVENFASRNVLFDVI